MTEISKIVLVANNVGGIGGVSTFAATMAREFSRRDYEVLLLGFDQVDTLIDTSAFRTFTAFDAPTPEAVSPRKAALGSLDPRVRWSRRKLRKLRERGSERLQPILAEFDSRTAVICTQVFGMERLIAAGFDPSDRSGPLTFGQHHNSFGAAQRGGYIPRLRRSYYAIDRFVALTPEDAHSFRLAGLADVTAIANPVDMAEQTPDPESRTIMCLGRIDAQKRPERLIHAWSLVSRDFPDWSLELWGSGDQEDQTRDLIDTLGLSDSARMMGATSDVPTVLKRAAALVLSSDDEGLPLAIAEAARAGVPTVSVDCAPGIRELIDDGRTGIVTPARSVEGLAAGLETMMGDQTTRHAMGRAAQEKSQAWQPAAIVDQWEDEFTRALR